MLTATALILYREQQQEKGAIWAFAAIEYICHERVISLRFLMRQCERLTAVN
jgi:hypothetical protein